MPRYFMHLVDGDDVTLDPDGITISMDMIAPVALRSARDCIAGDVHLGRVDLRYRIDVQDESGEVVHSLPFADAVELILPS